MDHYSVRMCKYRENAQHAHLKGPAPKAKVPFPFTEEETRAQNG